MPHHTPETLLALLDAMGIATTTVRHAPAFTVADALTLAHGAQSHGAQSNGALPPGVNVKNLFLKDAKGQLWLVSAPFERQIDLKALPAKIGSKRLSFGNPTLLMETLGVIPGAVTPFAPINDTARRVRVVLDAWMMGETSLNCHPLANDATTSIAPNDLIKFLTAHHHAPALVDLAN
jgi:Ala-tRNA(Pro) deacylase